MPEHDDPTGESPSPAAADPLVAALTDLSTMTERFAGRLEANEKADDELRLVVVRALEVAASRNATLERIETQFQRQADAAERAAVAEEERLAIAKRESEARAATAAARWKAMSEAVSGFVGRLLKHPLTVAVGGALLFGIGQTVASMFGFNLADYMTTTPTTPAPVEHTLPEPVPAPVPAPVESVPSPAGDVPHE